VSLGMITLASVSEGSSRRCLSAAVNLLSSATIVVLAIRGGVPLEEQGLSPKSTKCALRLGGIASVPVALAMISGARIRSLRDLYRPEALSPVPFKTVLAESLLRVPFITALPEELIFRGGLLALASRATSTCRAAALTSLLFGLFHIAPTLSRIRGGSVLRQQARIPVWARVLSNVIVTALAGLALARLRFRSRSIMAPWLVHSTANASGILAGWFASPKMGRSISLVAESERCSRLQ
jgi:membrane protease YdiL (CAAX protease family)